MTDPYRLPYAVSAAMDSKAREESWKGYRRAAHVARFGGVVCDHTQAFVLDLTSDLPGEPRIDRLLSEEVCGLLSAQEE